MDPARHFPAKDAADAPGKAHRQEVIHRRGPSRTSKPFIRSPAGSSGSWKAPTRTQRLGEGVREIAIEVEGGFTLWNHRRQLAIVTWAPNSTAASDS